MLFSIHKNKFKSSIALEILKEVDFFFKEKRCEYCAVGGTLLGFVRHGDIMSWDDDVDLLVHESDITQLHQDEDVNKLGFHVTMCYLEKGIHFKWFLRLLKRDVPVDLWPWMKLNDRIIGTFIGEMELEKTFPLKTIDIKGTSFPVPKDPCYYIDKNLGTTDWRQYVVKRVDGHEGKMISKENYVGQFHFPVST